MVTKPHASDRIIVRYKVGTGVSASGFEKQASAMNQVYGTRVVMDEQDLGISGVQVLQLPSFLSVKQALTLYAMVPDILYVQPDYQYHTEELVIPRVNAPTFVKTDSGSVIQKEDGIKSNPSSFNNDAQTTTNIPFISDNYSFSPNVLQPGMDSIGSDVETESYEAERVPNDPQYSSLWGMSKISAPSAWDITTGSSSVIVAVLDTGVDYDHPDLTGNVDRYNGYDFAYGDRYPNDVNQHGTHCSGTIGGYGNNGIGVAGVAWRVTILPVKVLDDSGSGWDSNIASGIYYARDKGASIVSMSLGGPGESPIMKAAIQNSPNILFVCAAGNDNSNTDIHYHSPSCIDLPNVISVAATDSSDNRASFSNYGPTTVDLAAPGVNILSTVPGNGYASWSGTSMATPHVSGVAALVKSVNPSYTPAQIKSAILSSVDKVSSMSGKCVTGGRLNSLKVVRTRGNPSQDNIGVFRGRTWYLDDTGNGAWGSGDKQYTFGLSGDKPVIGDWNGDSKTDTGVFRGRTWYLDYTGNGAWGSGDRQYTFGLAGDIPVTGDWNGDHKTDIGVFRGRTWYLDYNGNGVWDSGDRQYTFGLSGDIPVTGDWNGDEKTDIGVFRGHTWYLDYTGNGAWNSGDKQYTFGLSGDKTVTGDWNGDGKTDIGVFRGRTWYLDYSGNGAWGASDKQYTFGLSGDVPVSGKWA